MDTFIGINTHCSMVDLLCDLHALSLWTLQETKLKSHD
jgi:hypothetical protein